MSLRIAVIGASGRGLAMARLFEQVSGCRAVAFADPFAPAREMAAERFPGAALFESCEELLDRSDVDAVLVASADHAHEANGLAVLARRKHLYLEKPMAQSVAGCDALLRTWSGTNTVFMVGLELRECVLFRRVREILDAGEIGRPVMGLAIDNVSVGGDYFYHNHYRKKAYTRSLLLQKGVHTIDLLNWFMGGNPCRVFASGGLDYFGRKEDPEKRCRDCERARSCRYYVVPKSPAAKAADGCVWSRDIDLNDNSQLSIDYDNGARAIYMECHFTPEYTREFTLFGDEGKLTAFYNNECDFLIRVTKPGGSVKELRPAPEKGGHGGSDINLVRAFFQAIEDGKCPVSFLVGARNAAAVGAAGEDSIETGLPVTIPPPPL